MEPLEIKTERLVLRTPLLADLSAVAAIWGDREGGKYLPDPYYTSGDELRGILDYTPGWFIYYFVAALAGSSEVMATCSLGQERPGAETWSIGYTVRKDYWGNGYAPEMVRALVALARELGAREITAPVAQANIASNRVMEKCGFQVYKESSFTKKADNVTFPSYIYRRPAGCLL